MPLQTVVWECAIVGMLRYIIGDDVPQSNGQYIYSDTKLKNLILYSGFLLDKDISYGQNYTFDLTQMTITPDPLVSKDFAFINLSVLKSAVILARNELKTSSSQAIRFKDGQSEFDGKELYKAKQFAYKAFNDDFEHAWAQYQFGDTAPGNSILGPYSSDRINFGTNIGFFGEGVVDYVGRRSNANYSAQGSSTY